jgi:hypothetical protein
MKQFYKVRVVINYKDGSCTVQTKSRWFSPWEFYHYLPTDEHVTAEKAKNDAIACADRISASRVIYEVS